MLLKQKPDLGLGIVSTIGSEFNLGIEANLMQWIGKFVPSLSEMNFIPSGVKAYIRLSSPMEDPFYSYYSAGLSKDIYFGRFLSIAPYVGFSSHVEDENATGFEAGINGSIALLHNFQIVGGLGYNTFKSVFMGEDYGLTAGVGLRIQF
jgi:hypothetical protein